MPEVQHEKAGEFLTHRWREYRISEDASHHLYKDRPAYAARFREVAKFHAPGLAPVRDATGAYHVTPDGRPAYHSRFVRAFGFYAGRAAVHSKVGWFHILPDGTPLYQERYAWCGNFQEERCTVRQLTGGYSHISSDGTPAYEERYRYAGDFKDGYAVVQGEDGKHTHIDASGNQIHGRWFQDLDVFHKRYARACDWNGWHHVRLSGQPLYKRRFKNVEPFYNGQARVEAFDGSLSIIDEAGEPLLVLRKSAARSHLEELSGDMVGLWRTQTIRAAVELGVFESLPASAKEIEHRLQLPPSVGIRLMRALMELGLVQCRTKGVYHSTDKGALLQRKHPLSLSDAARHWGQESYAAWAGFTQSLRDGRSSFERIYGKHFFDWISDKPADLMIYHSAMSAYAKHDYQSLTDSVDFSIHNSILDAGGGTGELTFALLRSCPRLVATVMDRPEVVERVSPPPDLEGRCGFIAGDLFQEWPVRSNTVVLARVLHDWPDHDALRILGRAREAMRKDATLYVIEMVLNSSSGAGGLLDMNMLVMTQGVERTAEQFRDILAHAGFELIEVIETGFVSSVIRAKAA